MSHRLFFTECSSCTNPLEIEPQEAITRVISALHRSGMVAGIHIFFKCGKSQEAEQKITDMAQSLFPNSVTVSNIYNTGFECQAYLYYIANNYDTLPENLLFLNGISECHTPMADLAEMLKCLNFAHPFLYVGRRPFR